MHSTELQEWFREQKLNIHLSKPVKRIIPDSKEVETRGGNNECDNNVYGLGTTTNNAHEYEYNDKENDYQCVVLEFYFHFLRMYM